MPLTPFHFGPALLFGLIFFSFLDFPAFVVANVAVDFEPLLVMFLHLDYPLHGFFHSFIGGTLVALLVTAVMSKIRPVFSTLLAFFKLEQKASFRKILVASFSGIYLHILLDSRMHPDIRPFYPFDFNPFLNTGALEGPEVYIFTFWCFVGGIIAYGVKLALSRKKST
jgi:membrane-bound metal-dependent hydrolase YbcI (DUF457 family)